MSRIPRFIALCGHPKSGKSTVQKMLQDEFGIIPVDDGKILRDFAVEHLGVTREQVTTQAGKLAKIDILGRTWTVREILGEYGNLLEAMFGSHFIPMAAVASTKKINETACFSFGSVRRDQGLYYQKQGGLVIGIANPLAGPSPFEFDRFDSSVVDFWINNDGQSRGLSPAESMQDLRGKVTAAVFSLPRARKAA